MSDFRVYYGCEAGKNQLCDKSGHVICAPCYYGDKCQTYCNSTMFENCNCSTDGKLQCSEKPVGVYFDVRLISVHIPPNMHNTSYTLSLDQRYSNRNLYKHFHLYLIHLVSKFQILVYHVIQLICTMFYESP